MRFASLSTFCLAILATSVLGTTFAAHADPTPVSATTTIIGDGGEFTGSITQYFTGAGVYSGSFTYTDGTNSYVFQGSDLQTGTESTPSGYYYYSVFENSNGDQLWLGYDETSYFPITGGATGVALCSVAHPCSSGGSDSFIGGVLPNGGTFETISDGSMEVSFALSAATPEPSSLALLGTGVLGIAGAARRRFLRA